MRENEVVLRLPFEALGSFEHGVNEVRRYYDAILKCERVGKRFDLGMVHPTVVPEASTMQAIKHPNVVEVVGAMHVDGFDSTMKVIEIVTPFYPRGSITDALLRGENFEPREAVAITQAALRGLREMHISHALLHRDVKSGNILLTDPPIRAVVADIGMATAMTADAEAPGASNVNLYSAPELLSGASLRPSADVYGMGLVLTELLGGPFDYGSYSRADVHAALDGGLSPLRSEDTSLPVWVPSSLRKVIARATNPNPSKRFQSAKEMDDALTKVNVARWRPVDQSTYEASGYGRRASTVRIEVESTSSGFRLILRRRAGSQWRRPSGFEDVEVLSLESKEARSRFDAANAIAIG